MTRRWDAQEMAISGSAPAPRVSASSFEAAPAERRNAGEKALFDERFFGPGQAALFTERRGSGLELRLEPQSTKNPGLRPPAGANRKRSLHVATKKARPGGSDGVNPPGSSSLSRATGGALAGSNALRGHRAPTLWYRRRGENEQVGLHEWMGTMAETGSSVSRARTAGESQGSLGRTRAS